MKRKNNEVYDRNYNGLRRLCGILQYNIYKHGQMNATYEADYIIVLGSKVNGTKPSYSLQYRIDKAADYLQSHEKTIAIVSGGKRGRYFRSISNEKWINETKNCRRPHYHGR